MFIYSLNFETAGPAPTTTPGPTLPPPSTGKYSKFKLSQCPILLSITLIQNVMFDEKINDA